MYTFTTDWFLYSEIKQLLSNFIDDSNVNKILEIGSFEGSSSCFFSDHFLTNEKSTLVCVDPFDVSDSTSPVYKNMASIFIQNISKSKNWNKVRLRKMYSTDFFKQNKDCFTFIYIDGSHIPDDIKNDFINSLEILSINGIIWMDDYASSTQVKELIDKLYYDNKDKLTIIHKGYQIAFRKTM